MAWGRGLMKLFWGCGGFMKHPKYLLENRLKCVYFCMKPLESLLIMQGLCKASFVLGLHEACESFQGPHGACFCIIGKTRVKYACVYKFVYTKLFGTSEGPLCIGTLQRSYKERVSRINAISVEDLYVHM